MTILDAYNVNVALTASTTAATRARARVEWFGRNGPRVARLCGSRVHPLRRECSSPNALDNREGSIRGNDAPKPEPGSLQQLPELRLGALSTTWREHQHLE